tara:strand:- start:170 stop:1462 length:1293 start_codon:yes stop_codon:yes gene_type:complete
MKKIISTLITVLFISYSGYASSANFSEDEAKSVLENYSNIAFANYSDALKGAMTLDNAINVFINSPSAHTLNSAKLAWIQARAPYQQTEAFRFGNAIVDDWEGKVNAWPLDEGLIDYVASSYGSESDENSLYSANVIANKKIQLGGDTVDVSKITKKLISETLHEIDEVEANVATGYHVIEFLLWGQDLNGTNPGAGNRSHTDYLSGSDCTNGNCDRRAQYLKVASELLIDDLVDIVLAWDKNGEARQDILSNPIDGVRRAFVGMGSLAYGELAGERIKLGLMVHDPEEEHDCFSDNTHWSHYWDAMSIQNIYTGTYHAMDGSTVSGPSISDLVAASDSSLNNDVLSKMKATDSAMTDMVVAAEDTANPFKYDQMLGEGSQKGEVIIMNVVNSLVDEARALESAVEAIGLSALGDDLEGSDSLDNPDSVI